MIEAGTAAPDFTVDDQDGNPVSLKDFKGRKVALYFYPKDMTPGCTTQACNLRDHDAALAKAGIQVLGVSADEAKRHVKFIEKYDLPFPLLADTDKAVAEAYGVWGEKKMYGKSFMGIKRTTFLINEEGQVVKVIAKPKVKEHAAEVLAGFEDAG